MSDGGKGSSPRPFSVSDEEYASRWDAIFSRDLKNKENTESLASVPVAQDTPNVLDGVRFPGGRPKNN